LYNSLVRRGAPNRAACCDGGLWCDLLAAALPRSTHAGRWCAAQAAPSCCPESGEAHWAAASWTCMSSAVLRGGRARCVAAPVAARRHGKELMQNAATASDRRQLLCFCDVQAGVSWLAGSIAAGGSLVQLQARWARRGMW